MTLRDELEQLIRWELSGDEAMLRSYQGGPGVQTIEELVTMMRVWVGAHQKALMRLADEVEALKHPPEEA